MQSDLYLQITGLVDIVQIQSCMSYNEERANTLDLYTILITFSYALGHAEHKTALKCAIEGNEEGANTKQNVPNQRPAQKKSGRSYKNRKIPQDATEDGKLIENHEKIFCEEKEEEGTGMTKHQAFLYASWKGSNIFAILITL